MNMSLQEHATFRSHDKISSFVKNPRIFLIPINQRKVGNSDQVFLKAADPKGNGLSDNLLNITGISPDIQRARSEGKLPIPRNQKSKPTLRSLSYPGRRRCSEGKDRRNNGESLLIHRVCKAVQQQKVCGLRKYGIRSRSKTYCSPRKTSSGKDRRLLDTDRANSQHKKLLDHHKNCLKKENHLKPISAAKDSLTLDCKLKAKRWQGNGSPESCHFLKISSFNMKSSKASPTTSAEYTNTGNLIAKDCLVSEETPKQSRREEVNGVSSVPNCEAGVAKDKGANLIPSETKVFTKRLSKLIEVDGINYMVTMEPPGTSNRRPRCKSVPILTADENSVKNEDTNNEMTDPVSALNGVNPSDKKSDITTWYKERTAKSTNINVARCGTNDVIDPLKVEALDHAALRLRNLVVALSRGLDLPKEVIRRNLQYSINVMETNFLKSSNKELERATSDDEVLENLSGEAPVPQEIKSWLVETFSHRRVGVEKKRGPAERRTLRSVVHAVQAGILLDRMLRKGNESTQNTLPLEVLHCLKSIDKWSFDVFELERVSSGNALKYVCYKLLTKHNLLRKFKIPPQTLFAYCNKLQRGYRKHNNRYHNPVHAADVAQTLNCLLDSSGFVNWFSDLEIFSMIMAAVVHDLEHTGTTNNFHINTRSSLAILYNDRSILEHHHVSTAFRMMQEEGCDILHNFTRDDFQECRTLMIEMVLATDMNHHFEQIKNIEAALQRPDLLEKSKAMCMLIHSSDINHPSKPWMLHYRWTERLVFEFFDQGDRERELNLPISPLCDRHSAKIAQSQIGFIDFVVNPTFSTLFHVFNEVNAPTISALTETKQSKNADEDMVPSDILKCRFGDVCVSRETLQNHENITKKLLQLQEKCFACIAHNRDQWTKKDALEMQHNLIGEDAFTAAGIIVPDPLPSEIIAEMEGEHNPQFFLHAIENGIAERTENNENDTRPP